MDYWNLVVILFLKELSRSGFVSGGLILYYKKGVLIIIISNVLSHQETSPERISKYVYQKLECIVNLILFVRSKNAAQLGILKVIKVVQTCIPRFLPALQISSKCSSIKKQYILIFPHSFCERTSRNGFAQWSWFGSLVNLQSSEDLTGPVTFISKLICSCSWQVSTLFVGLRAQFLVRRICLQGYVSFLITGQVTGQRVSNIKEQVMTQPWKSQSVISIS